MATASTTRAASAQATRRRLLDAAIRRFAADGLGTSFDAVAADAGVTKGALYHHFGSKDGLVQAVYREAVNRHAQQVLADSAQGSGRERLLGLIDASARLYTSREPFYRLLIALHIDAAGARPQLLGIAERVHRQQREHMTSLVRAGQADGSIRADVDAEAVGVTVNAALEGFVLVHQLEPAERQGHLVAQFRRLLEDLLA
jgi:AcrR family transcriptional regulator